MSSVLKVTVREVYGKRLVYPANEVAGVFANLARTRTLSHSNLQDAERLGFTIIQQTNGCDHNFVMEG